MKRVLTVTNNTMTREAAVEQVTFLREVFGIEKVNNLMEIRGVDTEQELIESLVSGVIYTSNVA